MIKKFLPQNIKAIITTFKWTSVIFTSIVLIIFGIGLINNQKPDIELFITVVLSASIGFPLFILVVGLLRWSWDTSVTNRNFSSFPFSMLESIGFNKALRNEASRTKFVSEYYTGRINDFIVNCDVDTQYKNEYLSFKYYVNIKPVGKTEYSRIQKEFDAVNGIVDINWISKEYHYKNHRLKSEVELQTELIDFAKMIQKENIRPSEVVNRL